MLLVQWLQPIGKNTPPCSCSESSPVSPFLFSVTESPREIRSQRAACLSWECRNSRRVTPVCSLITDRPLGSILGCKWAGRIYSRRFYHCCGLQHLELTDWRKAWRGIRSNDRKLKLRCRSHCESTNLDLLTHSVVVVSLVGGDGQWWSGSVEYVANDLTVVELAGHHREVRPIAWFCCLLLPRWPHDGLSRSCCRSDTDCRAISMPACRKGVECRAKWPDDRRNREHLDALRVGAAG